MEIKRALVWSVERCSAPGADERPARAATAAQRNLGVTDDLLRVNREASALIGERAPRRRAAARGEPARGRGRDPPGRESQRLLAGRVEVITVQPESLAGMPPDAAADVAR